MTMTASLWSPFTYVQLRELERQIMIYKYFMACVSVPAYLLSSSPASTTSNITDPVEGRCRRTDGKKWRCLKYATPNNNYCERHMHRGSGRSRRGSGRSRRSVELGMNSRGNCSSHFLASRASHPYLQPSFSCDNHRFGLRLAPCFDPSNMQLRMLNEDPMSLGASNSGWHNNIPVKSLPQSNTLLLYNPLLVPLQSEKPRGISCNASASASVDQSMMDPLGEMLKQSNTISISDSSSTDSSSPVEFAGTGGGT
ncbi:hypothetical protein KIW84_053657 [Lathyrus oleraceus]|uniref:Growth-regulating factor n=2 Tax=Pisum sativum TaxID=3888 RepID=A0A9D5AGH6_PEA|nr:hypothetical protein KIW84_053657 [Pisum sativum]